MATKPLGTLFSDSVDLLKKNMTAVLIGAVVFGALTQGVSLWLVSSSPFVGANMMAISDQMQDTEKRIQELSEKAKSGGLDEASQQEMEKLTKQMMDESMQGATMLKGMFMSMLPGIGISILLTLVIGLLAKSYFLVIAVKNVGDPGKAFSITVAKIVPLIGLWLWLLVRTFVWIPVVGIITLIVLGPRFIISPVYLLDKNKGVMDSARMSYGATTGYWGKIFGNAFVAGLVTMVCAAILSRIAVGVLGMTIGGFLGAMVGEFATAFMTIFAVQLAYTVMEHPWRS